MAPTTWHVWQQTLTDPDQCVQFACPEEGDRPDGNPWTDPAPWPIRGQQTVIDHVGSVEGPALGPYGLGMNTQSAIQLLAADDVALETTVAAHFDGYQTPEPEPSVEPLDGASEGLNQGGLGTDLPLDFQPV